MGLFDSFRKKGTPAAAAKAGGGAFPELYAGMKAEVLTEGNSLIFVGTLDGLSGTAAEVHAESAGVIPQTVYNRPVKLRCFRRNGETFTLIGNVTQNTAKFWRIVGLKKVQTSENRNFFRQNTGVDGFLAPGSLLSDRKSPCKILDVSAGGARVQTERLFAKNATFQLEASLLPEEKPFHVTCKVVRVSIRSAPGSVTKRYEYGCQFVDMPPREQERLLQSIFVLQRRVLQARREQ